MSISREDEVALLQLIGRYTHTLDYGSIPDMASIWTEDCLFVVDNPAMRIEGLAALLEMLRGTRAGYPQVRHVVSNCYVEQQGGSVVLHSYLQIFDTEQMKVTMFARYRDRCVKTAAGWRIAERACVSG